MTSMFKTVIAKFHRSPKGGSGPAKPEPWLLADQLVATGRSAEQDGRLSEACEYYEKAVAAAPAFAPAHLNLGIVLGAMGNGDGAKQAYREVLALDPQNPFAHYNLGNLAYAERDFEEAERLLRSALRFRPQFPEAHVALANTLDALQRTAEAADELASALLKRPGYQGALYNYSMVLNKLRRFEDAEDAATQFLEAEPQHLGALESLAIAFWGQGRWAEGIELFKVLREKMPEALDLESKELFLLNYDASLPAEYIFARHRDFGRRIEQAEPARFVWASTDRSPERRLRIGYLSPDFNWHPVALFILPVIERHDRERHEVFCYYTEGKVDDVTRRLRSLADHWIDAGSLPDFELANIIHRDRIDILVDLAGHTGNSRLRVFAKQPAPVQAGWMGYLNTTGLTRIQYRLCDARTDPAGVADALHTETLVRLPHSQWCYRPFVISEMPMQAPWEKNGHITFGSFNHSLKISPRMCALWADILTQVPDSKLLCVGLNASRKMAELLSELTLTGVDSERIQILPRVGLDQYYAWFTEADIALDTFPYGGGTTTFDALFMGAPVVAATGSTPTSRSAASILAALGLDEWIAPTIDDYVRVAVERANDRAAIAELRRTLRPRMEASPLMDEEQFVRDLEAAYRRMWREYCAKAG